MGHKYVTLQHVLTAQFQAPASMVLAGKANEFPPQVVVAPLPQEVIQKQIDELERSGYDMVHASEGFLLFFKEDELHGQKQAGSFERTAASAGNRFATLPPVPPQGERGPGS